MENRLDLAVLKGCDGVEPDNMDGYLNASGFNLNADDQLAFNKFIANEAHKRGLAVMIGFVLVVTKKYNVSVEIPHHHLLA